MASNPKTERSAIDEILEGREPVSIVTLNDDEYWESFDETARWSLGMSGEEFLRRWDEGEWNDDPDQPGVMTLYMMMKYLGPKHRPKVYDWD